MLVNCPECELQVSDKAITCPHCGYPLKPTQASRPRVTSNKRRRLPNGFGQISEIKGKNLRKPFRAMVTVGKSESGRPICKPLKPQSYFETYNEAYLALVEHNRTPYDINSNSSMQELFERWKEDYFQTNITDTWKKAITLAWSRCGSLYDMPVKDVRSWHIKECLNNAELAPTASENIKTVLNMVFDYAVEYEMAEKNYARLIVQKSTSEKSSVNGHIAFTDEEMELLWENVTAYPVIELVLIQCYSGWRPQELFELRIATVDMRKGTYTGGSKTDAGKDRIVPIHSRVAEFVEKHYNKATEMNSEYLFNLYPYKPSKYTYSKFRYQFDKMVKALGLNTAHRPHDGRKQFVTMAKQYNVDEYAIKRMVGHAINDLTEEVYTERSIAWLKQEIEKIK